MPDLVDDTNATEVALRTCVNDLLRDIETMRDELVNFKIQQPSELIGWCDTLLINTRDEYGEVL